MLPKFKSRNAERGLTAGADRKITVLVGFRQHKVWLREETASQEVFLLLDHFS